MRRCETGNRGPDRATNEVRHEQPGSVSFADQNVTLCLEKCVSSCGTGRGTRKPLLCPFTAAWGIDPARDVAHCCNEACVLHAGRARASPGDSAALQCCVAETMCSGAGRDRACAGDICGQDGGGHGGTAGLPIQWARIQAGFRPPCSRATSLQSINSTATRARCSRVSSVPIPSFALTAGTYQI